MEQGSQASRGLVRRFGEGACHRSSKHRGWSAIDGEHVASFDDHLVQTLHGNWIPDWPRDVDDSRTDALHANGFFGREFAPACFVYSHSNHHSSLTGLNPIVRALALLNAKVGRRRLAKYANAETHPLPKALAEFRMAAEADARANRQP
jgi:hypothetical protein